MEDWCMYTFTNLREDSVGVVDSFDISVRNWGDCPFAYVSSEKKDIVSSDSPCGNIKRLLLHVCLDMNYVLLYRIEQTLLRFCTTSCL